MEALACKIRGRILAACALVFLASSSVTMAQDDARTRARERFAEGVSLFQAEHYAEALTAFNEAYRLSPHPAVLVNIANCHMNLSQPIEAARYFERHLRETRNDGPSARRTEAEQALGRARADIASIEVSAEPGTSIRIDGQPAGVAPLDEPVEANPGTHRIEFAFTDGTMELTSVELAPGASESVVASERSRATPAPPIVDAPTALGADGREQTATVVADPFGSGETAPADETHGGLPIGFWIAGGIAVATLATGIGFGVVAQNQKADFNDTVREIRRREEQDPNDPALPLLRLDGEAIADAQATNALIADVFFVGAAVATGVTIFIGVRHARRRAGGSETAFVPLRGGAMVTWGRSL